MPFLVLHVALSFLLDLAHVLRRSDHDRALELVLLRQQLRLYERQARQPRPSRWEQVALASLAARLPDLSRVALVFTPATLLRWHREIVKRAWTFGNRPKGGRPPVSAACVELLLRLARENPRWGDGKPQGELLKLGHRCVGRLLHPDRFSSRPVVRVPGSRSGWSKRPTHPSPDLGSPSLAQPAGPRPGRLRQVVAGAEAPATRTRMRGT